VVGGKGNFCVMRWSFDLQCLIIMLKNFSPCQVLSHI
jgi:hypothetical protein